MPGSGIAGSYGNSTFSFCFFFKLINLWLCWVFVSVRGLSLVAASGGHSSSRCAGLSLSWPLLLRSTGSSHAGSAIVAHGPSRSTACGIFPDQGSNPCPLHWQADSQPLHHQGSPHSFFRCSYQPSPMMWLCSHSPRLKLRCKELSNCKATKDKNSFLYTKAKIWTQNLALR